MNRKRRATYSGRSSRRREADGLGVKSSQCRCRYVCTTTVPEPPGVGITPVVVGYRAMPDPRYRPTGVSIAFILSCCQGYTMAGLVSICLLELIWDTTYAIDWLAIEP